MAPQSLPSLPHGFTAVDFQRRPRAFVDILDRMDAEPFHAAYKRRLRTLLRAEPGGQFLDVGAGAGGGALALMAEYGVDVVAVDRSLTMTTAMSSRGVRRFAAADAHRLPFGDDRFDGAWTDRVLQHVADPATALDEMLRVVRPGGRIAVADPDYDTQVLDIEDQSLARRVLRFRADSLLRNGALAHRHAGLLTTRGVQDVTVEAHTLLTRDPTAADNVMGLRTWAHTAADRGELTVEEADRFTAQFDESVRSGRFLYTVTFFVTAGTVR